MIGHRSMCDAHFIPLGNRKAELLPHPTQEAETQHTTLLLTPKAGDDTGLQNSHSLLAIIQNVPTVLEESSSF